VPSRPVVCTGTKVERSISTGDYPGGYLSELDPTSSHACRSSQGLGSVCLTPKAQMVSHCEDADDYSKLAAEDSLYARRKRATALVEVLALLIGTDAGSFWALTGQATCGAPISSACYGSPRFFRSPGGNPARGDECEPRRSAAVKRRTS